MLTVYLDRAISDIRHLVEKYRMGWMCTKERGRMGLEIWVKGVGSAEDLGGWMDMLMPRLVKCSE